MIIAKRLKAANAVAVLLLAGCATVPNRPLADPPTTFKDSSAHFIAGVPAVAQRAYQCGPASLESVFRYWDYPADADTIGDSIYNSGSQGVLNFTLESYARRQGFWVEMLDTDIDGLKAWLKKDMPLIVMLRGGFLWASQYHFVVLKGFDEDKKVFYANTGENETRQIDTAVFETAWQGGGRWTLLVCPVERVDWPLEEPLSRERLFLLGRNFMQKKDWAKAETAYAELLSLAPHSTAVSNNLAWIYLEQNRPEEAVRVIQQAFRHGAERRNFEILDTLGVAYSRLGWYPLASRCLSEALRRTPVENVHARQTIQEHLNQNERRPL